MKSILAVIPARGGSKGIKHKNIAKLAQVPLIDYTIKAAVDCALFAQIVVNSDDARILSRAEHWKVTAMKRPADIARDDSPTAPVIVHTLTALADMGKRYDTVVLLQPTSPFRTAEHIREAVALYDSNPCNMVISVVAADKHPMKAHVRDAESGFLTGAFGPEYPYKPRQSLPDCYYANGAIYVFSAKQFLDEGNFAQTKVLPYIMSDETSMDIDEARDLVAAEEYLNRHQSRKSET